MICDLDIALFQVADKPALPQIRAVAQANFLARYSKLLRSKSLPEDTLCNITRRFFEVAKSTDEIALKLLDIAKSKLDEIEFRPELFNILKEEFGPA